MSGNIQQQQLSLNLEQVGVSYINIIPILYKNKIITQPTSILEELAAHSPTASATKSTFYFFLIHKLNLSHQTNTTKKYIYIFS